METLAVSRVLFCCSGLSFEATAWLQGGRGQGSSSRRGGSCWGAGGSVTPPLAPYLWLGAC